ncbi:MAG TPA: urease accessory protein UreF [Acetobacteraceae bacterium]|nr:urease accessory protein UreF [Acetobacteraceae bacterium]
MTTRIAEAGLLRLLAWLSPAFPTGGYTYSHGLEWAVETGDVRDEATLRAWLRDVLTLGAGWSDAILLRAAWRGAAEPETLSELAELAAAVAPCRERRLETLAQGDAFLRAAAPWGGEAILIRLARPDGVAYPVAVGALAGAHGVEEDAACAGFLQAFAANVISAAVRLIPLGQNAGLRVLAALQPVVSDVAAETRRAGLDDLGGACFRSDIAAMRHETQYTRLFRT